MRAVVVGAGAWGFAAAAELTRRGHAVTLVDRHGPGNALSSSSGPTRLWRVGDPYPPAIRFGRRALTALRRISKELGVVVHRQTGLLWRDGAEPLGRLVDSLREEVVEHELVRAEDVASRLPGLRPDGRSAVWLPEGGPLLAGELLGAYHHVFARGCGELLVGRSVVDLQQAGDGARVVLDDGRRLDADVVVACPGPGAPELLRSLGLDLPVQSFLEQVVHLGTPGSPSRYDGLPCLFDGPTEGEPGIYTMPTPGVGYKIGLDDPLRPTNRDDLDRTPDPSTTDRIVRRARRDLSALDTQVIDELVCCWTDSLDGWFIVDRVGAVVIACGDSGKGFKYSPVMGEALADLAEGRTGDSEVVTMRATRFSDQSRPPTWAPTRLGTA
jgi:sarcosine oxidase